MKTGRADNNLCLLQHNKANKPLIGSWIFLDLRNAPCQRTGLDYQILKWIGEVTSCNGKEIALLFEERDQSVSRNMVELKALCCDEWLKHSASIAYLLDEKRTLRLLNGVVATFGTNLSIEVLQVSLHGVLRDMEFACYHGEGATC